MLAVYEIDKPDPTANINAIAPKRNWTLKFPNAPFDCESLFIWKDYGYVISKVFNKAHAQIFRFPLQEQPSANAQLVATTKIESPVTGADISADGNLLGLVAKDGAYVYRINGDVARANEVTPHHTKIATSTSKVLLGARWAAGDERAARNLFVHRPAFRGQ